MSQKIFDIPFIAGTSASDFTCRDGEIETAQNLVLTQTDTLSEPDTAEGVPRDFQRDFKPLFPPIPEIRFALLRETLPGWHLTPDQYPSFKAECPNPNLDNWGKVANRVLSAFHSQASSANLFVTPFLVIAAWKTPEGAYVSPTAPVLMIPNSEPIPASTEGNTTSEELDIRIPAAVCSLCHKITLPESLRDWTGKIENLEILISDPLFQYDSAKSLIPTKRLTPGAFTLSLDTQNGTAMEKKVCTDTLTTVWKTQTIPNALSRLYKFHTFAQFPLGSLKPDSIYHKTSPLYDSIETALKTDPIVPSYTSNSIVGADGSIDFKGRKILWNPHMLSPDFQPLERVMCEASEKVFPLWIFHPDPEATEYQYLDSGGVRRKIPLKRHPYLFGSYFDGGLAAIPDEFEVAATTPRKVSTKRDSHILVGEQDEPYAFTDKGLQNLAVGEIIALCRAFRSSGLVATVSPTLYVFCTTGIYLFKENSNGLWSDAGLLARYVLKSPESITLYPQLISFVTTSGETVIIEGTKVKTLSASTSAGKETKVTIIGTGENGILETRPLKLDGAGKFKRVRRIFLRGYFNPEEITMTLSGCRDMRNWITLAGRKQGSAISLLGGPCRFFKVKISVRLSPSDSLQGITVVSNE